MGWAGGRPGMGDSSHTRIYFSAAWAWSTHLLLLCLCWLLVLAQRMEQSSRVGLWAGFGLLAGFAGLTEPSVLIVIPLLHGVGVLAVARTGQTLDEAWADCKPGNGGNHLTVDHPQRNDVSSLHSHARQHGAGAVDGKQRHNLRWTSDDLHPVCTMRSELAGLQQHGRGRSHGLTRISRRTLTSMSIPFGTRGCRSAALSYLWTGLLELRSRLSGNGADRPGEHSLRFIAHFACFDRAYWLFLVGAGIVLTSSGMEACSSCFR